MENIILRTDSYKFSHWLQYPPGTRTVFSYFESRGGVFPEVTFFGLQYFLKKYLAGEVVTAEKIDWAERRVAAHMGGHHHFNRAGWEHILNAHGGRLPVLIRAVPEGTTVPTGNVLMTIENTDPECFWLTNYLETLLVQVWYPCTVATQSRAMKKIILNNLEETGDPGLINFKLHDFGFRGVSSVETAGIGGAAHLVNFRGTDTFEAVEVACQYYQEPMAGYSIPASEHSTITSWGREHEVDAFRNMLDQYPGGLVACVSDSYDIFRACREYWGSDLKDRVLGRNGTLVVRPDSGNPPTTVVHVLNTLGQAFGYTRNSKGFTVLPPQVRVIQGDGIDFDMMGRILFNMKAAGWSARQHRLRVRRRVAPEAQPGHPAFRLQVFGDRDQRRVAGRVQGPGDRPGQEEQNRAPEADQVPRRIQDGPSRGRAGPRIPDPCVRQRRPPK
jgi:nicotinamide phosphoribosyltransferase